MRRRLLLSAFVALLIQPTAARAETPADELVILSNAFDSGQCETTRLQSLVDGRGLKQLGSHGRSLAYAMLGFCDPGRRTSAIVKAISEAQSSALAWSLSFYDSAWNHRNAEAAASLHEAVARRADGTLRLYDDELVYGVAVALKPDPLALRRFLEDLSNSDWRPTSAYLGGDWLWSQYAGLLLDEGDGDKARLVVGRIEAPEELMRMSLDRRFAPLVAEAPGRFDVRAAAERVLARDLDHLRAEPNDGVGVTAVADRLRLLGKPAEALALIDRRLATPGVIPDGKGNDMRAWLFDTRAKVLEQLGRFDEAIAARREAAHPSEGGLNVGQTLNLGALLNDLGRHEEALEVLSAFERDPKAALSPYGAMAVAAQRACANYALGRPEAAQSSLNFTAAHAGDALGARATALLCANDLDGAAAVYIERLLGPTTRLGALVVLSDFRTSPYETSYQRLQTERQHAVRARSDVQAAIAKAGQVRSFDVSDQFEVEVY